jgi:hypothetical protein
MKNLTADKLKQYYLLKQKMDYIKQLKELSQIGKEIKNGKNTK